VSNSFYSPTNRALEGDVRERLEILLKLDSLTLTESEERYIVDIILEFEERFKEYLSIIAFRALVNNLILNRK
jgi:hypothetical protein